MTIITDSVVCSFLNIELCCAKTVPQRNDKLERCMAGYDITRYVPPPSQDSKEDNMRNDEESSDHGTFVDSDEEEEEDEFLRDLFDSGLDFI